MGSVVGMRPRLVLLAALAVILGALPVAALAGASGAQSVAAAQGVQHLHFRFGPLDIKPGQNVITTNKYEIPQPRSDGWIVGFRPNLKLPDGTVPPVDQLHLHHGVWANSAQRDATAPLFPQRFIAAGEEKTALQFPAGYGYAYRSAEKWWLNYMVHDLTEKPFTVYLTYDVDFVPANSPAAAGMKAVHPIWMDVRNGELYPVFDALKGSGTHGRFTYPDDAPGAYPDGRPKNEYTIPNDGVLVSTGGHLHPGGLTDNLSLTRNGTTTSLFHSHAQYFEPAGAVSWDVAMTVTPDNWQVAVKAGDTLRVSTTYNTSRASWYESMGLMIVWMYDGPGGRDPFATNVDQPGHTTHGHLPENRNHGGGRTTSLLNANVAKSGNAASTIPVSGFAYEKGDLSARGAIPTVAQGQPITFDNLDAQQFGVWHTITACKAPCNASTGIAYPIADASVQFDSGQLGNAGVPTSGKLEWTTPSTLDPGTYTYFCRVHPFMRGAFRVVAAPSGKGG